MNNLQLQTKIFLGAVAGIMVARSFAPTNAWYLIPIGIAIWWAGTHKRKLSDYLIFSFSYAILFWLTHISWLLLVGIDAYVLLSILMSLIYGFSGYLMFKVRNLPLPFVLYALIFISIESLTDYFPFGGFPWGKIAYASADAPWAGLFAIGSAPLVTLTILVISSMLIPAVGFLRQKAISPAIFFIILIVGFNLTLSDFKSTTSTEIGTIDMAIIQGSVPRAGLLFNEQKMEVLKYHVDETDNLLTDSKIDIDVILWPENSIDIDPFKNPEALSQINNTLKKFETPLLSGAVLQQDTGLANSVLLWNEKTFQVEDSYIKSILVPFGEYLPLRSFLSQYIRRFDLLPQDFIPGKNPNNVTINDAKISPIVCFEIAWNKTLTKQINDGGQLVSVHTNNATYAFSNQIDQQFEMSRIRAIETGREVVISATTGISAHIDRNGSILWQSKEFAPESKIIRAKLHNDVNFAMQNSTVISYVSLFGFLIPLILLLITKIVRRSEN